jgi:hypothetical protein
MLLARLAKTGIVVLGQPMDVVLCGYPSARPTCGDRIGYIVESPRTWKGSGGEREFHFAAGYHQRLDGVWALTERAKTIRRTGSSDHVDHHPRLTRYQVVYDETTGQKLGYFTDRRPPVLPVEAFCLYGHLNTVMPDVLGLTGSPAQRVDAKRNT